MLETWRPIPEWPEYEVSDMGGVRRGMRLLRLTPDPRGYLRAQLHRRPERENWLVHRLVLLAFVGSSDLDANHKDGIKSNNALTNLEYATRSENVAHAWRIGLRQRTADPRNDADVIAMARSGARRSAIAAKYGISKSTVAWILRGRDWHGELCA